MASLSTDCVKVAIRVRPMVPSEQARGCLQIVEKKTDQPQLTITGESNSNSKDHYTFNHVFMPDDSQDNVYIKSVKPMIPKLFEGYNVTIVAYG